MEQVRTDAVRWDRDGLVCSVVQQHDTGEVLMVAWMNDEALERTLHTGEAWFYSRSRKKLWRKGETSGNVLDVVDVAIDCDGDTVLVQADIASGVACHTGERTCFHRSLPAPGAG